MLEIKIERKEFFNEKTNEFLEIEPTILKLEHSLASLAAWESKWCKPFLSKESKTDKEVNDYIKCMLLNDIPYPELVIENLSFEQQNEIAKYIDSPMTATWFSDSQNSARSRKIITAEIIYYWMIAQNIPMECQYWHLNRLLTLIKVCSAENAPKKKMSRSEEARSRAALNRARRMSSGSRG